MKQKKLFALLLSILCLFTAIPVCALESNTTVDITPLTEEATIEAPEIDDFADMLLNSSIISNVNISENTVTYTINNSIEASISKKVENGISIYTVVENGKTDIITIDPSLNTLSMNGNKLDTTVTTVYNTQDTLSINSTWSPYKTQKYNVSLTTRVRYATLSAVLVAMRAIIAPTSVDLPTIASLCIQVAEANQSNADDIIVDRSISLHVDYIAYRYFDTYKVDGSTVTTDTFEYWQ